MVFNVVLLSCIGGTLSLELYKQSAYLELRNRNTGQVFWDIYGSISLKSAHFVKFLEKLRNWGTNWERFTIKEEWYEGKLFLLDTAIQLAAENMQINNMSTAFCVHHNPTGLIFKHFVFGSHFKNFAMEVLHTCKTNLIPLQDLFFWLFFHRPVGKKP